MPRCALLRESLGTKFTSPGARYDATQTALAPRRLKSLRSLHHHAHHNPCPLPPRSPHALIGPKSPLPPKRVKYLADEADGASRQLGCRVASTRAKPRRSACCSARRALAAARPPSINGFKRARLLSESLCMPSRPCLASPQNTAQCSRSSRAHPPCCLRSII